MTEKQIIELVSKMSEQEKQRLTRIGELNGLVSELAGFINTLSGISYYDAPDLSIEDIRKCRIKIEKATEIIKTYI